MNDEWYPPKDFDFKQTVLYGDSSAFQKYNLVYYYAIITLIGADLMPKSETELVATILLLILGPLMMGLLIAEFSNVLYILTKRERNKTEIQDMITSTMF